MKKLIILITFTLFTVTCLGQRVEINNVAAVGPQKGFTKMNTDQASFFIRQKYRNSNDPIFKKLIKLHAQRMYAINNMVVTIRAEKLWKPVKSEYLANEKRVLDEAGKSLPGYFSYIETINNQPFLITSIPCLPGEMKSYYYYTVDKSLTKVVNGVLPYSNADSAEAKENLYEILRTLTFK